MSLFHFISLIQSSVYAWKRTQISQCGEIPSNMYKIVSIFNIVYNISTYCKIGLLVSFGCGNLVKCPETLSDRWPHTSPAIGL